MVPRVLVSILLLVNIYNAVFGSNLQGDCSKDGSCDGDEEKRSKAKYTMKGIGEPKSIVNNFCLFIILWLAWTCGFMLWSVKFKK